jgi:hypothetical protein
LVSVSRSATTRAAVRKAITTCVWGRDPDAAARVVAERDTLTNPFYGGA